MAVPRAVQMAKVLRSHFGDVKTEGAEIGVHNGRFSQYLLQKLPKVRIYMIDIWKGFASNSRYFESMQDFGDAWKHDGTMIRSFWLASTRTQFAADRRYVMRGERMEFLSLFADASLDWIFIDCDHTYGGVMEDLQAWVPKVRPGGLISGHDWEHPCPRWGVKRAVEDYIATEALKVKIGTGLDYTWWFVKPEKSADAV